MDDSDYGVATLVPVGNGNGSRHNGVPASHLVDGKYARASMRGTNSLAADVRDAELEILQHDAAGQLEELENMQKQIGMQQARIDFLEGSNSQLCIELEASNSHHEELVMQLRQSIDASNRERDSVQAREQELASENATLTTRVQYVDKNMSDLEFLLEHAVQREEKALQREKQALAALHQTQKSSENALGQGLPHEVEMLHRHLNAAEQNCNALDGIFRRCLFAAQAKDVLVEKLRVQLDASEDQLQKLLVCTAGELDTVRAQVRKSADSAKDDERSKIESAKEQDKGNAELLRMYDEQLKKANRKIAELEQIRTTSSTELETERTPTTLGLIKMHEEQHALLLIYEQQLKVAHARVDEVEGELVKLKLSSTSNLGSASDSTSNLDGLYAALETSRQKQREAEERAQILAEEKRSLTLAKQQLIMTQEIEAKELREKRMRQVVSRLMGKNVQWAFDRWCEATEGDPGQSGSRNDPLHSEMQERPVTPPSKRPAQQKAVGERHGATGDLPVKSAERQPIVKDGEDLTSVLARRREMGEKVKSADPKGVDSASHGDSEPKALDRRPVAQTGHVNFPLPLKSPRRVSLLPSPENIDACAPEIGDAGAQMASYVFGNGDRPIVSTFANIRPSRPSLLHAMPRHTDDGHQNLNIGTGIEVVGEHENTTNSARLAHLLKRAGEEVEGGGHEVLAEVIGMVELSCRNLEILPDVGDLALKLVRNARLEAARFQDELLSKEYLTRELQSKVQRVDAHDIIISDLQQSLMQALEREEAFKSHLHEQFSLTDYLLMDLEKLTMTMSMLEKEVSEGPNARISGLEKALQEAEQLLSNSESRSNADQAMLKDVLKSLLARDEEIAMTRGELDALRSSMRASVAASRQSIARDLNLPLPLALDKDKDDTEKRNSRGHISSIDIDMIYSRMVLAPAPRRAGSELYSSREPGPAETRVLDGDASAYEDIVDDYHRAAMYRQNVKGNHNVSSAPGRELSDLEIFERRLMGYDASPDKNAPLDNVASVEGAGSVEDKAKTMEERERELEIQRQKEWEAVAEKARAAAEARGRERELIPSEGTQLNVASMRHGTDATPEDAAQEIGDDALDTQQGQDVGMTSQQQRTSKVEQDRAISSASPSGRDDISLSTAVSEFVAPFHPFKAPSKLPKKIFEKFDSAHSSSMRPSNINGGGFGAEQAWKAQPHRPATPEEEYEHAFACEYNCGFHSESFAECSEHEMTCDAKPAEPPNKTSSLNMAPTPSVASADGPSPFDSQVKALVEVQQRLDKAAKQPAVVNQTAAASSAISGPSGGSEREGSGAGSGQGEVGADELPRPQSTLRDLAENQIRNEQENKGTSSVKERSNEKGKKKTKKSSKKAGHAADNLTDPSLYGPMVQNFMSKQQMTKQQGSDKQESGAVGQATSPRQVSPSRALDPRVPKSPRNTSPPPDERETSNDKSKPARWFGIGKKAQP